LKVGSCTPPADFCRWQTTSSRQAQCLSIRNHVEVAAAVKVVNYCPSLLLMLLIFTCTTLASAVLAVETWLSVRHTSLCRIGKTYL